jgi:Tol biopolymer transport system component
MMNKRSLVIDKIRVLMLSALLFCGANVMSQGHIDSSHKNNRASGVAQTSMFVAEFSSDGLIAFSSNNQIYVMNADGSGLRRLTDGAPGVTDNYPAFSPDGSRLAFIRYESKAKSHFLSVINIDGSGLQDLVSSSGTMSEPTWSPDGSRIAFIRGFDTTVDGAAYLASCRPQIYSVFVSTGKEVNLTGEAGGTDPAWSPDGTRIAFSSYRDDNYEIYTMDADGNDVKRITYTDWAEAEPAWSPDSKRIAYAAHLLQEELGCGFIPTGRPGGTDDERSRIYITGIDGANHTKLEITVGGIEPTWSHDGTRLALVINNDTDGSQIYVTDADGMSLTKLTSDSSYKTSPSWSNAGR